MERMGIWAEPERIDVPSSVVRTKNPKSRTSTAAAARSPAAQAWLLNRAPYKSRSSASSSAAAVSRAVSGPSKVGRDANRASNDPPRLASSSSPPPGSAAKAHADRQPRAPAEPGQDPDLEVIDLTGDDNANEEDPNDHDLKVDHDGKEAAAEGEEEEEEGLAGEEGKAAREDSKFNDDDDNNGDDDDDDSDDSLDPPLLAPRRVATVARPKDRARRDDPGSGPLRGELNSSSAPTRDGAGSFRQDRETPSSPPRAVKMAMKSRFATKTMATTFSPGGPSRRKGAAPSAAVPVPVAAPPATDPPVHPAFFRDPNPASLVDVYHEFCGLGRFASPSLPGGYERKYELKRKETGRDPLGGAVYPQYRVVRRVLALAREESHGFVTVEEQMERMEEEWKHSGRPFWLHFHELTKHMGAAGRVPFAAHAREIQPSSPPKANKLKSDGPYPPPGSASRPKRGGASAADAGEAPARAKRLRRPATDSGAIGGPKAPPTPDSRVPIGPVRDPNQNAYVEETSFLFHDPLDVGGDHPLEVGVSAAYLKPLPPPAPLPTFPSRLQCEWSVLPGDERVVEVNFRNHPTIPAADRQFFAELAERNDLVLIAEGILPNSWTSDFVLAHTRRILGDHVNDKIRRFDRDPDGGEWKECEDHVSMHVDDYFRYLKQVSAVRDAPRNQPDSRRASHTDDDLIFSYVDPRSNETISVNVNDTTFYMIDVEMYESLPQLDDKFKMDFKMQECLPGGDLDLMRAVRRSVMSCSS
jgi:hypothetical protein